LIVAGLSILIVGVGALAIVSSGARAPEEGTWAAGFTAFILFLVAIGALLWGGAHVLTGFGLKRARPWSRLMALALSVMNLFVLPFGTALAIYAFWALLSDAGRAMFE
jgi:TRAP-type C4-dicarboxylate transport system permease small subunit